MLERWTSILRTGWCPPCCWRCCWPGRWCSTASGLCLFPPDSQRSGWVLGKPRKPVPSVGPRVRELRNPLRLEWSPGLKRGFFGLDLKHGNITLGYLIKLCLCFIITLLAFKDFYKSHNGKVIDSNIKMFFWGWFFVIILKVSHDKTLFKTFTLMSNLNKRKNEGKRQQWISIKKTSFKF